MSIATLPKVRRYSGRIVIFIAFVVAALWLVQQFVLPVAVARIIVARLAELGYSRATLDVDHISLTSATLRNIHSPDGLDARLVHVTYSPLSLIEGRVDDLVVEDVMADARAFRKPVVATTRADRPPISTMSVARAAITFPSASGPATVQFKVDAHEQEDHRLLVSADASIAGVRMQMSIDADASLSAAKVTARIDGDLAALPGLLAREDIQTSGEFHVQAIGALDDAATMKWDLSSVTLDVEAKSFAFATAAFENARISVQASASGTGSDFVASVDPQSEISAGQIRVDDAIPPFLLKLQPRDLRLTRSGDTWQIRTQGAEATLSDLQFAFESGEIEINKRKVRGRIGSTIDLAKFGQSRFLQAIFPVLKKMELGGIGQVLLVRAAEAGAEGEDLPSLTFRIINGTIASQEYQLTAAGIESQIVLIDPMNPRTPPAQTLKMSYGQMGKWEVRDALFQFSLVDLNTLRVEQTRLGWAGGLLWVEPYDVLFSSPIIRSRVYGKGLDLGKLVWVATDSKAWAEGLVDLDIPVTFAWPRIRFGDGFVEARPGGTLHLDYVADQLSRYLVATDARFGSDPTYSTVRERVTRALRNFRFSKLRLGMKRGESHLDAVANVKGQGNYEGGQEVNLNVNVADLDWLLSRYLALPKTE